MALYKPTYTDPKTGEKKTQGVWWYHFFFDGRHIQESTKTAKKTLARIAERNRRDEQECSFNGIEDNRRDRIRSIQEIGDAYLESYRLRHRAPVFAQYAVGHVVLLLGKKLKSAIDDKAVIEYQNLCLNEKAAPKTINEETGFLLRMLEDQGDIIRAKMKRRHTLKPETGPSIAVAFSADQKAAMLSEAQRRQGFSVRLSGPDAGITLRPAR